MGIGRTFCSVVRLDFRAIRLPMRHLDRHEDSNAGKRCFGTPCVSWNRCMLCGHRIIGVLVQEGGLAAVLLQQRREPQG